MFTVRFKNGVVFEADTVSEGLRHFTGDREVVLILQRRGPEKYDLNTLAQDMADPSEIKVYEGDTLVETFTGYNRIVTINKTLQANKQYFYDIQFTAGSEDANDE